MPQGYFSFSHTARACSVRFVFPSVRVGPPESRLASPPSHPPPLLLLLHRRNATSSIFFSERPRRRPPSRARPRPPRSTPPIDRPARRRSCQILLLRAPSSSSRPPLPSGRLLTCSAFTFFINNPADFCSYYTSNDFDQWRFAPPLAILTLGTRVGNATALSASMRNPFDLDK